ncbi:central glycolytic genes regulator [Oikeobacillus pervagus]|uniref:Central glycolytic genes regulator n=1 Tax=Oikeobacillus pervagus TaxID=1325931 RepID=A0AAJ1WK83_9BACI|nr:sugar-binding domain-containing protein [Oikeobacillus pervagus]MDQ0216243.1 central glycolytic genes regulator [Oikeobacillus pervagus]
MRELLEIQKKLLPDLLGIMQKRYHILRLIRLIGPIGRRSLAQSLGMTERVLRSEIELLSQWNLIEVQSTGMVISNDGKSVLQEMEEMMKELAGLNEMEMKIQKRFQLQQVVVVPGNSDESSWVKKELGRACSSSIKKHLVGKNIIAVTGGTTMAAVAEMLTPEISQKSENLFVPARGGIGNDVENQANTICAKMADQTNSQHRVFHIPDQVSQQGYKAFINEPSIREVLQLISSANIVIHGIGEAMAMAKRRNTSQSECDKLIQNKAVAEAFGYYFNENGEVVHKLSTIGFQLEDLMKTKDVFAVAGGFSKGKAIQAYLKRAPNSTILITDEAAAKGILKEIDN